MLLFMLTMVLFIRGYDLFILTKDLFMLTDALFFRGYGLFMLTEVLFMTTKTLFLEGYGLFMLTKVLFMTTKDLFMLTEVLPMVFLMIPKPAPCIAPSPKSVFLKKITPPPPIRILISSNRVLMTGP